MSKAILKSRVADILSILLQMIQKLHHAPKEADSISSSLDAYRCELLSAA